MRKRGGIIAHRIRVCLTLQNAFLTLLLESALNKQLHFD